MAGFEPFIEGAVRAGARLGAWPVALAFAALLRQLAVRLGYDLLQRRGVRRRGVVGAGAICRVGGELVTVEAGLGAQVGRVGGHRGRNRRRPGRTSTQLWYVALTRARYAALIIVSDPDAGASPSGTGSTCGATSGAGRSTAHVPWLRGCAPGRSA